MEILFFTKPSTSSDSGRVRRSTVAGVRMFSALPYRDYYLDRDAKNEGVESVVCNVIGLLRSAGC